MYAVAAKNQAMENLGVYPKSWVPEVKIASDATGYRS
jgi:hypothetical protein